MAKPLKIKEFFSAYCAFLNVIYSILKSTVRPCPTHFLTPVRSDRTEQLKLAAEVFYTPLHTGEKESFKLDGFGLTQQMLNNPAC